MVGIEEKKIETPSQEAARSHAQSEGPAVGPISPSAIPNQPPLLWKQSSRPPQRPGFFMHTGKCSPPSVTRPRHKPSPSS